MKQNHEIYLASQSQRRIDFLKQLKLDFKHFSADIDETRLKDEQPLNYLSRIVNMKKEKAWVILESKGDLDKKLVVTADTIVVLGDVIFQKPKDKDEARYFLNTLSSRWHNVITGYSISDGNEINLYNFVKTEVLFKKLSEREIDFYLSQDEYKDKAGAYAVQGIGGFMVKKFVGSYSNIVGLPVSEFFEDLQKLKVIEL